MLEIDVSKLSVDNKFKLICVCCAVMHLTFLIEFIVFGMYFMACFNILSVLLYVCCTADCFKGTVSKHANRWINAIFAEIVVHAFLCTMIQGLDVGFYVYYMLTIPVAAYCLFFYEERKKFYSRIFRFTVIVVIALVISVSFDIVFGSVLMLLNINELSAFETNILKGVNILYAMICLCAFTIMFVAEIFVSINKLNEKNDELEFIAEHDALTGLYNRHALWNYFDSLSKKGESFCVILGDIDDFKKVNDTYGHDCGDLVLKSVAGTILNEVKDGEIAVRWGGEEMLVILLGSKNECLTRIEGVRKRISELKIVHDNLNVKVSMTFGLVDYSETERSEIGIHSSTYMDLLISVADKRLYDGKNSGKNKVVA